MKITFSRSLSIYFEDQCLFPYMQAAIGGLALDMALAGDNPEFVRLGTTVLTTAVLSIIITAPIGALAIALSGPRFLNKLDRKCTDLDDSTNDPENEAMLPSDSEHLVVTMETTH